jgi:enoyl-CoA hydratase/carnithine racemase
VVLTAAGERAFCTGVDLKERQTLTPVEADHLRNRQMFPMYRELDGMAKPMIAAVFGHTLAGGFELALCADLIVAAEGASFGLPEVKWGLIPAAGGCRKLPALVGPARAKEIILTASTFDAATALQWGAVNRVVPRSALLETALALATAIRGNMQHAVRGAKRAIDDGVRAEAACRYDMEVAEVCYAQRNLDAFGKS